jgi:ribosome-interacting GTPase 1
LPTNLSPEAAAARSEYMQASSLEEQIRTLKEYIALVPKHKGTENLLYNLKKRLSKLQFDLEKKLEKVKKGRAATVSPFSIKKEGAGQVVVIGITNAGRSSLMNILTNVDAEIADYDFTTQLPVIGMMAYEDILVQLIEMPAIFEDMNVKGGNGRQILSAIRNADIILLIIDLSKNPLDQMDLIINELESANIRLNMSKFPVTITKTGQGGVVVIFQGQRIESNRKDIVELLQERKIHNAVVKISDNCSKENVLDALNSNIANRKAIIVANKGDIDGSKKNFRLLTKKYSQIFPINPVSTKKKIGFLSLQDEIFKQLDIIRVYTKEPGKDPSPTPIILDNDAVVQDLAERLHNKFLENFKYARITRSDPRHRRKSTRKQVGVNYELQDGDVVQFYT